MDWDNVVGIVTQCGLAAWGLNPVGVRFSALIQTGPGSHPASYTVGTRSFPGVKQPRHGVDHPPPSNTEVKESRAIHLLPPFCLLILESVPRAKSVEQFHENRFICQLLHNSSSSSRSRIVVVVCGV